MPPPDHRSPVPALPSRCASCRTKVTVDLASGSLTSAGGRRGGLTYADPDIVVWDCPDCLFANADEVGGG